MDLPRFSSTLIRMGVPLSLGGMVLLSSEGRRKFAWRFLPGTAPAVGSQLTAVEYRWVVWKLLGWLPIWMTRPRWVELPMTRGIGSANIQGSEYFGGFDHVFDHRLCKLNLAPPARRATDRTTPVLFTHDEAEA